MFRRVIKATTPFSNFVRAHHEMAAPAFRINAVAPLMDKKFPAVDAQGNITSKPLITPGKWNVLVFFPLAQTFVCPSELIAFSNAAPKFNESNAEVTFCSVDSVFSWHAWLQSPRKEGGVQGVNTTFISDLSHAIGTAYDCMLRTPEGDIAGHHTRLTVITDDKGVVRHYSQNAPAVGRNVDEFVRLVEAYQFSDKHGEVCPTGWNKDNKATIKPSPSAKLEYFEKAN
jgi:peroxiredoxin (alkyl hydroperoxide reductase subunit C)